MQETERRGENQEYKRSRPRRQISESTQRYKSSRAKDEDTEKPYKSSTKIHQNSENHDSIRRQYEKKSQLNNEITEKLYGTEIRENIKYLPITQDPMCVFHVDSNIVMFFQCIDDIHVANIQIYRADKQTLVKQFKYEKCDLLFIDFQCILTNDGYYIYYTTNYGIYELNCIKIQVQHIYKCDIITKCPTIFGNIMYFIQNDLNSKMGIQDVQLVSFNLETQEVMQTIQLSQQRVLDLQLDRNTDDLLIISQQLVDVTDTVIKDALELKPYLNQKCLCLSISVFPVLDNSTHNLQSPTQQYKRYLLDLPIEKLIQFVLNNQKMFIMYVKNQNHLYCITLNSETKLIELFPIQLTQYISKQVQIKKIIYQDGQFLAFSETSCYLFKIIKEGQEYAIYGIKEYIFKSKHLYSQYICKKTDRGETINQLISKDMSVGIEENEDYVSKRQYIIEDIDFSKAVRGNQQKIVYLSVD